MKKKCTFCGSTENVGTTKVGNVLKLNVCKDFHKNDSYACKRRMHLILMTLWELSDRTVLNLVRRIPRKESEKYIRK